MVVHYVYMSIALASLVFFPLSFLLTGPVAVVAAAELAPPHAIYTDALDAPYSEAARVTSAEDHATIRAVPFFSQFKDISDPQWKKVGCGIASLAMLVDFYKPGSATVDELLEKGIAADAYLNNAGWIHAGLINIAKDFDLGGKTHDLSGWTQAEALENFKDHLTNGPLIASVHYTFEPTNPIPHLVVITEAKNGSIFYNDPAEDAGGGSITEQKFLAAWKKRYIEIRPLNNL